MERIQGERPNSLFAAASLTKKWTLREEARRVRCVAWVCTKLLLSESRLVGRPFRNKHDLYAAILLFGTGFLASFADTRGDA